VYRALSGHAIGVKAPFQEMVALAKEGGFEGVELGLHEIADLGVEKAKEILSQAGLVPAGGGLPVNYKEDEASYHKGMQDLPRLAGVAAAIGCDRINTFIWPCSDELTFKENYRKHVDRLRPAAQVLADHGCRLSMEFLAPRSIRKDARYNFVYNMDAMLTLCATIGDNVGLLLDCWHLHMAGQTNEDVARLDDSDIVYVHVNDAPVGLSTDEVIDTVRCMPAETGVIDITGFMQALEKVSYSGPVLVEPFSERINSLSPQEAIRETADSLKKIWNW
jgi:sugar phosphate isomerase/epimerase